MDTSVHFIRFLFVFLFVRFLFFLLFLLFPCLFPLICGEAFQLIFLKLHSNNEYYFETTYLTNFIPIHFGFLICHFFLSIFLFVFPLSLSQNFLYVYPQTLNSGERHFYISFNGGAFSFHIVEENLCIHVVNSLPCINGLLGMS